MTRRAYRAVWNRRIRGTKRASTSERKVTRLSSLLWIILIVVLVLLLLGFFSRGRW